MSKLLSDNTASRLSALLSDESGHRIPRRKDIWRTPFPYGKQWPFGLGIDGNNVTIYNPMLRRYGDPQGTAPNQAICYTCADTTITFGGDGSGQRVCWKWSPAGGLVILPDAQVNDPIDDGTYIYGVVAIFNVENSIPSLAVGGCIQCGQIIALPVFTVAGS